MLHCIKMDVLTASIQSLTEEKRKLIQENKDLSESLADESKIKISPFSFVIETHRKQDVTEEQVAWNNKEIAQLKHQITQLLAMVPHATTTNTPPYVMIIILIIITSSNDIQPSTVVSDQ